MEILSEQYKPEIYKELSTCLDAWCSINKAMDADAMLTLYHKKAVLLGTFANKPRLTPAQIVNYFYTLFGGGKVNFDVHISDKLIYEQNGIVFTTGEYVFSWQQNDHESKVPARFTFVFSKENGSWKIFHHHSSVLPE